MTYGYAVLGVFVTWVLIGTVLGWAMGRRGYGRVFLECRRCPHGSRRYRLCPLGPPGRARTGPAIGRHIDGVQGPSRCGGRVGRVSLGRGGARLGGPVARFRIGRLTVVTVIGYDTAEIQVLRREEELAAEASLSRVRPLLGETQIDRQTLVGWPADVLRRLAVDGSYDLIVVGSAGRGVSKRLLGSTAELLTAESPVPVIVGRRASNDLGTVAHASLGSA